MTPGFLAYVTLAPVLIFLIHVAACRILTRRGPGISPQLFLMKLILFLNLPLVLGTVFFSRRGGALPASPEETLAKLVFAAVVFNGFGYAYFHLFNLSETGRRVRMLVLLRRGRLDEKGMKLDYSVNDMVEVRVRRLIQMGQIRGDSEGRYRIANRFFLGVALLLRAWRRWFWLERGRTA